MCGGDPTRLPECIIPVLAGGGGRLPAHIGVLAALQSLNIGAAGLVGVSGGSIVGSLYATGYDLDDIRRIAGATDFRQFFGQSLLSLLRTGGLSSGNRFEQWLDDRLEGRRFSDLERDLHVVATDVRSGQPVIFDRANTPDMKVALAVRFSMSVPLLFSFREFGQHLLVDGSILSEASLQQDWGGKGVPVVVFRLRSSGHADNNRRRPLFPVTAYMKLLVQTFLTTLSREFVSHDFWLSTVIIEVGAIPPLSFGLSEAQKLELYRIGFDTTREILPLKLSRQTPAPGPTAPG